MKILIAAQNYFPENNGQAVFVRRLAEGLAGVGYEVLVMTPSPDGPQRVQDLNGVRVESVCSIPLRPLYPGVSVTRRAARAARRVLDRFPADLIHVHDHFPLSRGVVRAGEERGIPMLGTNHFMPENIIPFVPVLSSFSWGRACLQRVLWDQVLAVFRRLHAVTAPTETAGRMLEEAGLGSTVEAISNGIDLGTFHPLPVDVREARKRLGVAPGATVLFFVGRVDREKRLDVVLHALQRLQRADVCLVVGGLGRDRDALQALARNLDIADRVIFPGFVNDLPAALSSVDVFVMPSEAELQSIATLEAMACGRPVLAADAHALPELVEDGVNGRLFRAGDVEDATRALRQLLEDRPRWAEMGRESMSRAARHDTRSTVARYEALYKRLLAA